MNRKVAREIAEKITNEDLKLMFEAAKVGITDWTKVSRLNKSLTKGSAWNILYVAFDESNEEKNNCSTLGKRNMIYEFQDFLPKHLIPDKKCFNKKNVIAVHQEPKF